MTMSLIDRLVAARGARITAAVLFLLTLFYALTATDNLSETDDAWAFGWRAEHIPIDQASDPRLLGYHVLGRGLWLLAQAIGLPVSGLQALRGIALVGAVVGLWFVWRVLTQRLAQPREVALAGTALLGLSYGYWRYAVEGDVYVSAMALTAAVLWLLLAPRGRLVPVLVAALVAGVAVLYYQPTTIPLFLAFPLLVLWQHGLRGALLYTVVGVSVVLAGYGAAFLVYWPDPLSVDSFSAFLAQRTEEFILEPLDLHTLLVSAVRAVVTLVHVALSQNWVFALPGAVDLVQRVFPGHQLDEEMFIARHAGWLAWLPLVLLPLCVGALGKLLHAAWSAWRADAVDMRLRERWGLWALALWALLTLLINGRLNAAGNEAWIVFGLPVVLLAVPLLLTPAWLHGGLAARRALWVLVAALGLHNAVGMAMVHDAEGDLVRLRSAWLVEHARKDDLIIVVYDLSRADFLRQHSVATVAMVLPQDVPRFADAMALTVHGVPPVWAHGRDFIRMDVIAAVRRTRALGGRVLVFDEFINPYPQLAQASPRYTAQMKALRDAALPIVTTPYDSLLELHTTAKKE